MRSPVERLLYIALVLLFIVTSIGVYFFIQSLHQSNSQAGDNAQAITEVKKAVLELKVDKAQRDAVIIQHIDSCKK